MTPGASFDAGFLHLCFEGEDLEAVQHNWLLRGFFRKKDKQPNP